MAVTTEIELIAHARQLIAGYKVPKGVTFRTDPLPLSGAMKVLKRELRALTGRATTAMLGNGTLDSPARSEFFETQGLK